MDIIKIAILGIVGALLAIMLKSHKKEYELFVTLGVSLCIFYFIMSKLQPYAGICEFGHQLHSNPH